MTGLGISTPSAVIFGLVVPLLAWRMAADTGSTEFSEAASGIRQDEPAVVAMAGDGLAPEPEFRMPPSERFAVVVERPLFQPSRRPPAIPIPMPAPAQPDPLRAVLRGVVANDGKRIGLLAVEGQSTLLRVAAGDLLQGWRVEAIEDDSVRLRRGSEETTLRLPYKAER